MNFSFLGGRYVIKKVEQAPGLVPRFLAYSRRRNTCIRDRVQCLGDGGEPRFDARCRRYRGREACNGGRTHKARLSGRSLFGRASVDGREKTFPARCDRLQESGEVS